MTKIPSVLKWLIVRRGRLLGEIRKTEKRLQMREASLLEELERLEPRVATLKARLVRIRTLGERQVAVLKSGLSAVDQTIGQHPVLVDVEAIGPINTQERHRPLAHGQLTRLILRALREADGASVTTSEVALFVELEGKLQVDEADRRYFHRSVRKQLRSLHAQGRALRVEVGRNCLESRWRAAVTPRRSNGPVHVAESIPATLNDAAPADRG